MLLTNPPYGYGRNPYPLLYSPGSALVFSCFPFNERLQARYIQNHWALTKFCAAAFKGSHQNHTKKHQTQIREKIIAGRSYEDLEDFVGSWSGEEELKEIEKALEARPPREHGHLDETPDEPSPLLVFPRSAGEYVVPDVVNIVSGVLLVDRSIAVQ